MELDFHYDVTILILLLATCKMANVYTRKNHYPRTTTLSDFCGFRETNGPEKPRILSPTRRCNPHPPGLVFQKPYNRDNMSFDIWNPDRVRILSQFPKMANHLESVNFSCGPLRPYPTPSAKKGPPVILYTEDSDNRISFCAPKCDFYPAWRKGINTTRFGNCKRICARGIVPSLDPPSYTEKKELKLPKI